MKTIQVPASIPRPAYLALLASLGLTNLDDLRRLEFRAGGVYAEVFERDQDDQVGPDGKLEPVVSRVWIPVVEVADPPGFTCPRCGRTSYNPRDLAEGYCGACHDWTGKAGGQAAAPDGCPVCGGPVDEDQVNVAWSGGLGATTPGLRRCRRGCDPQSA